MVDSVPEQKKEWETNLSSLTPGINLSDGIEELSECKKQLHSTIDRLSLIS